VYYTLGYTLEMTVSGKANTTAVQMAPESITVPETRRYVQDEWCFAKEHMDVRRDYIQEKNHD
jgi:hypothetical protein